MIIKGVEYADKEQAGKALLEACKNKSKADEELIGEYRGFKMLLSFDTLQKQFNMTLKMNIVIIQHLEQMSLVI